MVVGFDHCSGNCGVNLSLLLVQVGEKLLPPIYLELFADVAPKCVENFRILCRGELAHGDEMVGYEGSASRVSHSNTVHFLSGCIRA